MNITEQGLARHIGSESLTRLQNVRIGIAGAGGLGSNCAHFLVRAGFKQFVLVDFDRVKPSNLNRQFFFLDQIGLPKVAALAANLLLINPDLELELRETRITGHNARDLFARCDAVVECVDDPVVKKLLVEAFAAQDRFCVAASGVAGCGDADRIRTRPVRPGFILVGDERTAAGSSTPPLAPIVALAAAKQADAVLDHFLHFQPKETYYKQPPARLLHDIDIYCLTSEEHSLGRSNLEVVRAMLDADVKLIQYREKNKSSAEKLKECAAIRELTHRAGTLFLVNDDVAVAQAVDADGVHVGQDDLPVPVVRRLLGPNKIIGLSTHAPNQARAAVEAGADYIGVGPIFATKTKKDVCAPVGLEYLEWVAQNISIPFVAIGGIKVHNIGAVVRRGTRCVAMITEIVSEPDIGAQIQILRRAMQGAL